MSICNCDETHELQGAAGQAYVRSHLVKEAVDAENWKILYRCPATNWYWKKYYPHAEAHGGGAPEFIRLTRAQAEKEFRPPIGASRFVADGSG